MAIIFLPLLDKDLLAECTVHAYRASGSGGRVSNVMIALSAFSTFRLELLSLVKKSEANTSIKGFALRNCEKL